MAGPQNKQQSKLLALASPAPDPLEAASVKPGEQPPVEAKGDEPAQPPPDAPDTKGPPAPPPSTVGAVRPKWYRVVEAKTIYLYGRTVRLTVGKTISEETHGPAKMALILDSGVKLEEIPPPV
jgi:hypothetical protein